MKTINRFLSIGVLMTALLAVGALTGFGQDPAAANCADIDGHNALYTKFLASYKAKAVAEMRAALSTGKEYLEKYGTCTEAFKDQIEFVKPYVAKLEKDIPLAAKRDELRPLFARFDAGITADNGDEIYSAGRSILAIDPENINIIVPLGVAGLYRSYANDLKHTDDTIRYAQMALSKLKGGVPAIKKNKTGEDVYGALKYEFTKQQAIDELSYAVAHLTFYGKKDRKAALPLYYEIAQGSGRYKDDPRVYQAIGSYFGSEVIRQAGEVKKLIDAQKALPTEDAKLAMEPQIKEAIGLLNGTAERAMDYYSRAYKLAKSDTPAAKTYKDSLYKDLTILYEGRFNKKDGLDAYIATVTSKPVPNPTTPITPVNDPEPVRTTTTSSAVPAVVKPASAATTTPAKPATSATTTPVKPTVGTKAVVKKGTRK
jgi:hypothetical protein